MGELLLQLADPLGLSGAAFQGIGEIGLQRLPAGPGGEDESARNRQHEGEPNNQRAPPRLSHNPM